MKMIRMIIKIRINVSSLLTNYWKKNDYDAVINVGDKDKEKSIDFDIYQSWYLLHQEG